MPIPALDPTSQGLLLGDIKAGRPISDLNVNQITSGISDPNKQEQIRSALMNVSRGVLQTGGKNPLSPADYALISALPGSSPSSILVASSSPFRTAVADTGNQIAGAQAGGVGADTSDLDKSLTDESKFFQDRRDQLAQQYQSRKSGLETLLEGEEEKTKEAQAKEAASFNIGITNIGGYLGNSVSQQGALLGLAQKQRSEIATLQAKHASILQDAQNAFTEADYKLAKDLIDNAREIRKEISTRKQDFFNNMLRLAEFRQGETKFESEEKLKDQALAQKQLEDYSYLDPTKVNADDLSALEKRLGMPAGFGKSYLDVAAKVRKAKTSEESLKAAGDLYNILDKVPEGKEISIDGVKYSGLKQITPEMNMTTETDKDGNVTAIVLNKRTGKFTLTPLGKIGKSANPEAKADADIKMFLTQEKGVPENVIDHIAEEKSKGATDEQLKAGFKAEGLDPNYVDSYNDAVQQSLLKKGFVGGNK